jgi:hypothetical protein
LATIDGKDGDKRDLLANTISSSTKFSDKKDIGLFSAEDSDVKNEVDEENEVVTGNKPEKSPR